MDLDFSFLAQVVVSHLFEFVILGMIVPFLRPALRRLQASIDTDAAARLDSAIHFGIERAHHELVERAGAAVSDVRVQESVVWRAVQYVLPKMPDTLRALGITEKGLYDRVHARLAANFMLDDEDDEDDDPAAGAAETAA